MDATITLNKLKDQAEINAMKKLHEQFSTPDQLEQIDQHILRSEKRKMMVESQLKSAIQSHFISVNSCMQQLNEVNENLIDVREMLCGIHDDYKELSQLESALSELRKEAAKFKQFKSAKENVRNLLNVNDLSKQAAKHLQDNRLLLAHNSLLEIERCRNDILVELGPPTDKASSIGDIKLVEEFFRKVKELNQTLQKNIFDTIKNMLEISKSSPEQLVSALRCIEREEAIDEFWIKQKDETGFIPPDRPRNWRNGCKEIIRKMLQTK